MTRHRDPDRLWSVPGIGAGLGFDIELNEAIPEKAGYITARSTINQYIQPSPWVIQIGCTIPLSTSSW